MAKPSKKKVGPRIITHKGLIDYFTSERHRDLFSGHDTLSRVSTGLPGLDAALGGGYARGRVVELLGPEAAGKTSTALLTVAAAQKRGEEAVYMDFEGALDVEWATKLGADLTGPRRPLRPRTMEAGLTALAQLVQAPDVGCVVVDSVPAMRPRAVKLKVEQDPESAFDRMVAARAYTFAQFFDAYLGNIAEGRAVVIFINHVRQRMLMQGRRTVTYETTPGGDALKYYASVRLRCSPRYPSDNEREAYPQAQGVKIQIKKTKIGGSKGLSTEYLIDPATGACLDWMYLEAGLASGVIERSGAWYSVGAKRLGQGKTPVLEAIRRSAKLRAAIEQYWRVESPVLGDDDDE